MKLLLTSAGIKNPTIHNALVELLGKPIAESSALCISTAAYAFPGGADIASRLIRGTAASPLCELGWKSLGVLELTALPSLPETVYVGVSGGSLVMGPHVGDDFVYGNSPLGGDDALGLVDFSVFPHLDHEGMPDHSMAGAEKWAASLTGARVRDR